MIKHGYNMSGNRKPEYKAWDHMIQRCTNPEHPSYERYGGRGITVCERWVDFRNFIADMGDRPSKDYSIDRIDNDAGYYPENCRWATRKEQARNVSTNRYVEIDGERLVFAEACERYGFNPNCVKERLTSGWSVDEAFKQPELPKRGTKITDGKNIFVSASEAARFHNLTPAGIIYRCKSKSIKQTHWQFIP